MIIEDFIPTKEDNLALDLIKERNELIRPMYNKYKAGKISNDEYTTFLAKWIVEYRDKIREIYNE